MTALVPKLVPLPVGWTMRALGLVSPGVRTVLTQIGPYTTWWDEQNQVAAADSGPLLAVIGDSTAIGIGASGPDRGYVGRLREQLCQQHRQPWRVINLALSGARIQDGIDRQLPVLNRLNPDLVICCIGTNDVVWDRATTALTSRLHLLARGLPPGSCMATVAGSSQRAQLANDAIGQAVKVYDLVGVDPWNEPGPPPSQRLAKDRFHPNDLGYILMGQAFGRHLDGTERGGIPGSEESQQ